MSVPLAVLAVTFQAARLRPPRPGTDWGAVSLGRERKGFYRAAHTPGHSRSLPSVSFIAVAGGVTTLSYLGRDF